MEINGVTEPRKEIYDPEIMETATNLHAAIKSASTKLSSVIIV